MEVLFWTFFLTLLCIGKSQQVEEDSGINDADKWKPPKGNLYALLVAGSNGWWNYRHQADVAHAYRLLKSKGISEEHIIVMMYDDIARDPDNPYYGKLFNKPHGPDVYKGLKIDYKGDSVTPENFLNVLQGNAQNVTGGNGRVIKSNAEDRIFVYFTDHGGDGVICFPNDLLSKQDLNEALNKMHKKNRYGQLVFYLEACESGSMFHGTLSRKMNIYAMTASNPDESSWGTYCDNDMNLPCLGDLFSVNWMQDSEAHDINEESLLHQYSDVRALTNLSHVMRYGNHKITKEPVGWFEGNKKNQSSVTSTANIDEDQYPQDSWPSRDVELMHLQKLQKTANNALISKALRQRIAKIHEDRRNIETLFKSLVANLFPDANDRKPLIEKRNAVEDLKCHNDVVKAFDSICIDVNKYEYALKYMYVLNNLCVKIGDSEKIINAMYETCSTIGKQYL